MATLGCVQPSNCSHCQETKNKSQSHIYYLQASYNASQYFPPDTNEPPLEPRSLKARLLGSEFALFAPESMGFAPRRDQRPSVVFTRIIWDIKSKPRFCKFCRGVSLAKDLEQEIEISNLSNKDQERVWGECYNMATSCKDLAAMYSYHTFNLENIQNMTSHLNIDAVNRSFHRSRTNNKLRFYSAYNSHKKQKFRHPAIAEPQIKKDIWAKRHPVPQQPPPNSRLITELEDLYKESNSAKILKHKRRHKADLEIFARLSLKWVKKWAHLSRSTTEYRQIRGALKDLERLVHPKRGLRWTNAHRKRGWTGLTHAELPKVTYKFVAVGHVLRAGKKPEMALPGHLAQS